jgi:hypothetical protein
VAGEGNRRVPSACPAQVCGHGARATRQGGYEAISPCGNRQHTNPTRQRGPSLARRVSVAESRTVILDCASSARPLQVTAESVARTPDALHRRPIFRGVVGQWNERNRVACAQSNRTWYALVRASPSPSPLFLTPTCIVLAGRQRWQSGKLASQVLIYQRHRCLPHGLKKVAKWHGRASSLPYRLCVALWHWPRKTLTHQQVNCVPR